MNPARKSNTLEYKPDPNKFDLQTHRWDSQGTLVAVNHYRKFIRDGAEYYERPLNSGNLWHENNQPAGRVICEFNDKGHIAKKEFDFTAAHVEYQAPPTGAQKIAAELAQERAKSAALEAELRAVRKEREDRTAEQPVKNFAPQASAKTAPKLQKTE